MVTTENVGIRIRKTTLATLRKLAHPGQTIDGVIQELIQKCGAKK